MTRDVTGLRGAAPLAPADERAPRYRPVGRAPPTPSTPPAPARRLANPRGRAASSWWFREPRRCAPCLDAGEIEGPARPRREAPSRPCPDRARPTMAGVRRAPLVSAARNVTQSSHPIVPAIQLESRGTTSSAEPNETHGARPAATEPEAARQSRIPKSTTATPAASTTNRGMPCERSQSAQAMSAGTTRSALTSPPVIPTSTSASTSPGILGGADGETVRCGRVGVK